MFALALLVEVILIGVVIYSLLRSLATPENIVKSLTLSIWGGLVANDYIRKLSESNSRLLIWSKRRVKRDSPYGLALTTTLLIAAFFLVNFLSVLFAVSSKGSLTHIDTRVLNLIPSIRTPSQTTFFRLVTTLANTETAMLLVITMIVVLWRKQQRLLACMVVVVTAGEEGVTYIVKHLVQRTRPDQILSLTRQDSFSFPSGHAMRATVLFGLLAYFVYRSHSSTRIRLVTIGLYVLTAFFVAVSRIYFGVHYPTDVWGSILLGGSMLTLAIGTLEIVSRYELFSIKKLELSNKTISAIPAVLVVFALIASPFLVHIRPIAITRIYNFADY